MITTVSRGFCSATDSGISMPLVFCNTSTSVEYTSRNDTITLRMSIIGMRFSDYTGAIALLVDDHSLGAT